MQHARKNFFSEEKKQKTFMSWLVRRLGALATSQARRTAQATKVFGRLL
jgi:hypothetical protein